MQKLLWLEFRTSGGVRGGRSSDWLFCLGSGPVHICAEIVRKQKKNIVFENPQIRPPVETLVRGL